MSALFIYGTLRHPEVWRLIAGQGTEQSVPATLDDHAVDRAGDSHLPMLVERGGAVASGIMFTGLSAAQNARLDTYELPFGYLRKPVTLQLSDGTEVAAEVYAPPAGQPTSGAPWSLDEWDAAEGEVTRIACAEIARHDPPLGPDELSAQWHMIRARAHAALRARRSAAPATLRHAPRDGDVDIRGERGHWGRFFKLRAVEISHRRFDGTDSGPLPREGFIGTDAALLLAYDPAAQTVLLVEQFRVGLALREDANPWCLEPIAGIVDGGESPADAARREAHEEAGIEVGDMVAMFDFYPSPGASTDHFYCFATAAALGPPRSYSGGLDSEAEDLRVHVVPLSRALGLIDTGEIAAGPLIAMLYWLDRNRSRFAPSA